MKEYPFSNLGKLNTGEVEGKETIQLPTGDLFKFTGPKHSRGGIDAHLIPESRIFSDHLKLDKETVFQIDGTRKSKSPAQLSRKYDPSSYVELMEDKKANDLRKTTAQLMASKYQAMQDVVFNAQESHKDYNKKGEYKYGGKVPKYQNAGSVPGYISHNQPTGSTLGFQIPQIQGDWQNLPNPFGTPKTDLNSVYNGMGLSVPTDRGAISYYFPQGGDPYWTKGVYQGRGLQTGENLALTKNVQTELSYPELLYPGNKEAQDMHMKSMAYHLRTVDKADPDAYLTHTIRVDGKEIPVTQATDDQINRGELVNFNKRTGNYDLVDGRLGNKGESTHNHPFPVHATRMTFDQRVSPLPTIKPNPVSTGEIVAKKPDVPVGTPKDVKYDPELREEVGINPEDLLFGLQTGLDIANLATLERENPYYTYSPLETVQSRFDPINTLSQDRGFNIAKEALDKSNLPEQVKQAQLNLITANNVEGRNQVELNNYQGDLQNDNQNLQRVVGTSNQSRQGRNQANYLYMQELGRARYNEQLQKQTFIDSLLTRYREREQNKMNLNLLNQSARNYAFNPNTGKVEYVPNQGGPMTYDNLYPYAPPVKETKK